VTKREALNGKPYAGNPHVRFDEGEAASTATSRRGSLLYMGNELLVAPVVEKGVQSRKVVLPPGKWRSDDGQTCVGPAVVEVAAPLARLPYFEKLSAQQ